MAEEKVKRREEKIKEIESRKAGFRGKAPKRPAMGFNFNNQPVNNLNEPTNIPHTYDIRNGKKVIREYSQDGLKNAIHLIIKTPQQSLFTFLLSAKINPD